MGISRCSWWRRRQGARPGVEDFAKPSRVEGVRRPGEPRDREARGMRAAGRGRRKGLARLRRGERDRPHRGGAGSPPGRGAGRPAVGRGAPGVRPGPGGGAARGVEGLHEDDPAEVRDPHRRVRGVRRLRRGGAARPHPEAARRDQGRRPGRGERRGRRADLRRGGVLPERGDGAARVRGRGGPRGGRGMPAGEEAAYIGFTDGHKVSRCRRPRTTSGSATTTRAPTRGGWGRTPPPRW
jgi:hypothetical protein